MEELHWCELFISRKCRYIYLGYEYHLVIYLSSWLCVIMVNALTAAPSQEPGSGSAAGSELPSHCAEDH